MLYASRATLRKRASGQEPPHNLEPFPVRSTGQGSKASFFACRREPVSLNASSMRSAVLAERILRGLDQAMAGRPRPLRVRCAPASDAPTVAVVDYVPGFPCLRVTAFAFYSEKTAALLQALERCQRSGQVDEIEFCLLHAVEPGRSLLLDWLLDCGFAYREDGNWLVWRSPRLA